jgi:hypothetical protein
MSIKSFWGLLLVAVAANLLYPPEAVVANPTVAQLMKITESCPPLPNVGQFKTDESTLAANVLLCGSKDAIWFKADLDIDCDGGSTSECRADKNYLPDTSCVTSEGKPLDASNLPFFVLPIDSNGFKLSDYGIGCGSVGAIIYNGRIEYGILGDRGPRGVIGEASYAMAKRLGIDSDPNSGGVASGVTYIVFAGDRAVLPRPIEDHSRAVVLGEKLATLEVSVANAGALTPNLVAIANDEWNFFGKQTMDNDSLVQRGRQEGESGYWQRVVQYWKEGLGNSRINSRLAVMSDNNPWSAAFISYVFKKAGAETEFPYSSAHYTYITHAIRNKKNGNLNSSLVGYKVTEYSPEIGDLICAPRAADKEKVTYDNALSYRNLRDELFFSAHCDIVVSVGDGSIDVIGGNVSNSVTRNTVKTTDGKVTAGSDRKWLVVIQNNLD